MKKEREAEEFIGIWSRLNRHVCSEGECFSRHKTKLLNSIREMIPSQVHQRQIQNKNKTLCKTQRPEEKRNNKDI